MSTVDEQIVPAAQPEVAAPSVVRVKTRDLLKVLSAVLPMVDREPGLSIHGVLLEVGGGVLCATATDRFVLGHARAQCEGGLGGSVLIWRRNVKRLIRSLKDEQEHSHVLLSFGQPSSRPNNGRLVVRAAASDVALNLLDLWDYDEVGNVAACRPAPGMDSSLSFPMYRILFDVAEDGQRSGDVSLDPRLIGRFRPAAKFDRESPRWLIRAADKPVRIDVGDWFVGIVMPMRLPTTPMGPVPVGLPEVGDG